MAASSTSRSSTPFGGFNANNGYESSSSTVSSTPSSSNNNNMCGCPCHSTKKMAASSSRSSTPFCGFTVNGYDSSSTVSSRSRSSTSLISSTASSRSTSSTSISSGAELWYCIYSEYPQAGAGIHGINLRIHWIIDSNLNGKT